MKNGGPKTYRRFMCIPESLAIDAWTKAHEEACDAGVAEGIRFERDNQLRDMAKAAMALLTEGMFHNADDEHVPHSEVINWLYDWAEAMLAESDKRNEARETGVKE